MNTKRPRSSVWNYFQKDEETEYATCLIAGCKMKIKQAHGNTSNLLKHLKSKHVPEHEECLKDIQVNKEKRRKSSNGTIQPTLQQSISMNNAYPKESTKRHSIDKALIEMIVMDIQPISIVEDPGFQAFVHTLDRRYEIPSRRTVMKWLPETYQDVKQKLQEQLSDIEHVALTTDIWTSLQTKSYCCVTAHFITEAWELKSVLLETFEFDGMAHTADNIAAELRRVATAWGIDDKVVCVVTDNASNMVAAINRTPWRHLPCFAHSLNLTVQTSIARDGQFQSTQHRCKAIVSHFHKSVKSTEKLTEVQNQLHLPEHRLIQEVCTRWNSTYLMMERIHEQFEAITTALCLVNQNQLCLLPDDKTLISTSLTVLKPFLEATESISGDQFVSVLMIIPLIKLLDQSMGQAARGLTALASELSKEIQHRFTPVEGAYVTAVTTLLDPRFKKIPFNNRSAVENAITRMTTEVHALCADSEQTRSSESTTNPTTNPTEERNSLWDSFDKRVQESTSHRSAHTDAVIEVRRYFEEAAIDRTQLPLQWWKENAIRFPRLHKLARKYLCIPGSSVPSERIFSKAGQLVSERRNRLKPDNVNLLLFLNHNLKIV